MYKDEQSSLQKVEKIDNKRHVEVLVFKRKADKALDRELQEAGKELAEAEIAFVQAKKTQTRTGSDEKWCNCPTRQCI